MSPSKSTLSGDDDRKRPVNPRPLPLKISKHRGSPVIIYTRSPKIIHTRPRDFMALVQRLTGQSPPLNLRDGDDCAVEFDGTDLTLFFSPMPRSPAVSKFMKGQTGR